MEESAFAQYVSTYRKITGKCVNAEGYSDDGIIPWTGIEFTVRSDIDDYDTVEDWEEENGNVIYYTYRDFADGGSPDVVSSEFSRLYAGEPKPLTDLLIADQSLMFIYEIQNRYRKHGIKHLTVLETIALYINDNRHQMQK